MIHRMLYQAWLPCMGVDLGDGEMVSDRLVRPLAINITSTFDRNIFVFII